MGEELSKANKKFEKLFEQFKETRKKLPNIVISKGVLYYFFLEGIKHNQEFK
jgi:hypothetical protein